MNPIQNILNKSALGQIINLYYTVKNAPDQNAALAQQARTNPLLQQAMDIIRGCGGNAEAAFKQTEEAAKKAGVATNGILQMFK